MRVDAGVSVRAACRSAVLAAAAALALLVGLVPMTSGGPALAAATAGTPWTWGSDGFGQLGNGTVSSTPAGPAPVSGLADVVDLRGGREHVVALTSSGQVYTWGSNQEGQLGLGDVSDRSTPTPVPGFDDVVQVEAGHNHTVVLRRDGTVWAWGLGTSGQLGDGSAVTRRSPVQVSGITDAVEVAAGRDMSYAVLADGTVWAWGDNGYGELGDGTVTDRSRPVQVGGLTGVTGVAGGRDHGLALRSDGTVWAWGWNGYGQLGDGTLTNRTAPVQVADGVTQVAAGAHHSYALRADGTVLAWGRNYRSELGDGTTTTRTRPVTVSGVSSAVSIASGRDHGIAVLSDGTVRTWGYNAQGQLGDGTTTTRSRAVTVPGVSTATLAGGGGAEYSVVLVGSSAPPPNEPPTARIDLSCEQLACTFDAGGSSDPDGSLVGLDWTFGDGQSTSGSSVAHTYAEAGSYTVTLTVTDDAGATAEATAAVDVTTTPPATITFRGVAGYDGSAVRPTVTVPQAVGAGDSMLLFVTTNRAATATTPAGWTPGGSVSDGTDLRSWVYSRIADDRTAGTTVQVRLDATSKTTLTLVAYAGAGVPSSELGAAETGSTSQHRAPTAPVSVDGSTVVAFWADKVSAAHGWTLPPELTSRWAGSGTGGGLLNATVGDEGGVPAGSWPGATAVAGAPASKAVAWSVVLPPA